MFFLIVTFVLFGVLLWIRIRPISRPNTLPTYGNTLSNRNHMKDLEQARISPNDLFLNESIKRDTVMSGAVGASSQSAALRSPTTIHDDQMQKQLHILLQKAKKTGSDASFEKTQKEIKQLQESRPTNRVLTKNQLASIQAVADGQEIPTAVEEDSIEDSLLSLSEFKKLTVGLQNMEGRPQTFNFAKFSIQTKPGSAETLIESQYQ